MRIFVFVLLAVAAVSGNELKKTCEPGAVTKDDCNTCICSKDGTFKACTMMLCASDNLSDARVRRETIMTPVEANEADPQQPKICVPGTMTKMDCNYCICSASGLHQGCTLMACLPKELEALQPVWNNTLIRETRQVSHNRPCEAGKAFNIYCNKCSCGSDGFSVACTRMQCPEGVYNEDGSLKNPGQVSHNPLLRQTRQISHNRPCEAGKAFNIYCNKCSCGSDGFSVACTRMQCPEGVYNEDGSLKNPGQVSHNPLLRQTRQVSHNRPCDAGKQFKLYCNTCSCASDGFSVACTRMECPEGVYNEDGSLKSV